MNSKKGSGRVAGVLTGLQNQVGGFKSLVGSIPTHFHQRKNLSWDYSQLFLF